LNAGDKWSVLLKHQLVTFAHSIYKDSKFFSAWFVLLNWFELVYGLFGQSNMNHTLHFCPGQPGRNQMYQSRSLTVLIYILWVCWSNFCSDRGVKPVLLNLFQKSFWSCIASPIIILIFLPNFLKKYLVKWMAEISGNYNATSGFFLIQLWFWNWQICSKFAP